MPKLILGPILRYVDEHSATLWMETDQPCTVEVLGRSASTFTVGGHHYALVIVDELEPGSTIEYQVHLNGERAWPEQASAYPPSSIRTVSEESDRSISLAFGSCRYSQPRDPKRRAAMGPDALDAYARRLIAGNEREWPTTLILLGDQIYADDTSPEVRQRIAARRDVKEPPGYEVADFEEYTFLYHEAWREPDLRWLLSTVPSMMIFDDHDVRDDWNTSAAWREAISSQSWWHDRLIAGLASYWVYQHIGNLSPAQLADDKTFRTVIEQGASGDALEVLTEHAESADAEIDGTKFVRWSYSRDLAGVRVVMLDTRCGRILEGGRRQMLSDRDFEWLEQLGGGDFEHLVVGSSLPWLLPQGIHHMQSWNEATVRVGGRRGRAAERLRQLADLEHWAAFRGSFDRLTKFLRGVASRDAPRPATVSVLSGDVHHSYLARAHGTGDRGAPVYQVTCSPFRHALPAALRSGLKAAWSHALAEVFGRRARKAGVPAVPVSWSKIAGPYFGNTVGTVRFDFNPDETRAVVRIEQATTDAQHLRLLHEQRLGEETRVR